MKTTLAIDPSIRSCGWAYFGDKKLLGSGTIEDIKEFPEAADFIVHKLENKIYTLQMKTNTSYDLDILVIEYPQYERSMRGKVSMAQGHPLNLAYMVGAFVGVFPCKRKFLPTPPKWKGSLPKAITQLRLRDAGYTFETGDEADAIALGLWAINKRGN